jgi:Icc-related predicted phosphoesterase
VVVVTHHAPSQQSIHPRYGVNNKLSPAYASSLESLMGEPVRLWIHGHTHDSFDYCIEGTRVVANPRGYAPRDINAGFREDFVIQL